jgi:ParB-like chromosome segregation protein Spo0J
MELLPIDKIKPNPGNPRVIRDHKFLQLKKSLEDFPEMSQARAVVIDENFIILGGNMRWKAAKELGWKEINAIQVFGWTEEQKRQFIIKDNVGFGEWDWQLIAAEWPEVEEWGLDVPTFEVAEEKEHKDLSDDLKETFEVIISCNDEIQQHLVYNKMISEGFNVRVLTL